MEQLHCHMCGTRNSTSDAKCSACRSRLKPLPFGQILDIKSKDGQRLQVFEDRIEFHKKHLIAKDYQVIRMPDIRSVSVHKGILFGTLGIRGGGNTFVEIRDIVNLMAENAATIINDLRTAPSDRISASTSIPDQIRQLGELRDGGVITEDEFQSKKSDLLSRM